MDRVLEAPEAGAAETRVSGSGLRHAAGNVLLAVVAGPTLIRMLDRYARKLHGTFVPLEQT